MYPTFESKYPNGLRDHRAPEHESRPGIQPNEGERVHGLQVEETVSVDDSTVPDSTKA